MSELDQSALGSHDAARTRDAELAAIIGDRTEREGLPRTYRMRADSHYVDQLDRSQAGASRPADRHTAHRRRRTSVGCRHCLRSVSRSPHTASCSRSSCAAPARAIS